MALAGAENSGSTIGFLQPQLLGRWDPQWDEWLESPPVSFRAVRREFGVHLPSGRVRIHIFGAQSKAQPESSA